jgi:lipoprotein signal peptidase
VQGIPLGSRVIALAFAGALVVDFASKVWVVSSSAGVSYNDVPSKMALRLFGCLVTLVCVAALSAYAARVGLGRQFGLWIGCGLVIGGIVANGISSMLWARGVPDFIAASGWVWNLADFEIAFGTIGGLLSLGVAAVAAYVRTVQAR